MWVFLFRYEVLFSVITLEFCTGWTWIRVEYMLHQLRYWECEDSYIAEDKMAVANYLPSIFFPPELQSLPRIFLKFFSCSRTFAKIFLNIFFAQNFYIYQFFFRTFKDFSKFFWALKFYKPFNNFNKEKNFLFKRL